MARRRIGKEHIRNIQRSSGSYYVRLPVNMMRELKWKERQKVAVRLRGGKIIIIDAA